MKEREGTTGGLEKKKKKREGGLRDWESAYCTEDSSIVPDELRQLRDKRRERQKRDELRKKRGRKLQPKKRNERVFGMDDCCGWNTMGIAD